MGNSARLSTLWWTEFHLATGALITANGINNTYINWNVGHIPVTKNYQLHYSGPTQHECGQRVVATEIALAGVALSITLASLANLVASGNVATTSAVPNQKWVERPLLVSLTDHYLLTGRTVVAEEGASLGFAYVRAQILLV